MNDILPLSLGEVVRWGNHNHGLALMGGSAPALMIDGVQHELKDAIRQSLFDGTVGVPRDDEGSTHLVRVPGVPDLDMTPEELQAEREAGRAWQNYALLSGSPLALLGEQLNGWICIDPAGERWLVQSAPGSTSPRYGYASSAGALTFNLQVRPFGYFEEGAEEADPVTVSATLGNIGQANPPGLTPPNGSTLVMRIASVASHGRAVIISLLPTKTNPPDARDLPYGFLLLELGGPGPNFTATLSVLRTRAQCFGTFNNTTVGGIKLGQLALDLKTTVLIDERDSSGNILHGEAFYEATNVRTLQPGDPGWQYGYSTTTYRFTTGTGVQYAYMRDRLVQLTFDDQDQLVETALDWEEDYESAYAVPVVVPSGGYTLVVGSAVVGSRTGTVRLTVTLDITASLERRVRLKRNGEVMSSYTLNSATTANRTYDVDLPLTDSWISSFTTLTFSPASGAAKYMVGAESDNNGIPASMWTQTFAATLDGEQFYSASYHRARIESASAANMPVLRLDALTDIENGGEDSRRLTVTVMRLCNHLHALRFERYEPLEALTVPKFAKSMLVVPTAGAPWQNTKASGDTDPTDRTHLTGSYEPVTHAIRVDVDWTESNRERGYWI